MWCLRYRSLINESLKFFFFCIFSILREKIKIVCLIRTNWYKSFSSLYSREFFLFFSHCVKLVKIFLRTRSVWYYSVCHFSSFFLCLEDILIFSMLPVASHLPIRNTVHNSISIPWNLFWNMKETWKRSLDSVNSTSPLFFSERLATTHKKKDQKIEGNLILFWFIYLVGVPSVWISFYFVLCP